MSVRYFRRGKTRAFWVPAIANINAPTAGEIAAGTELSAQVMSIDGFTFKTDRIETPDLASEFTSAIGGEQKADDSALTIYLLDDTNPLRATLAFGEDGFVVFIDYKPSGAIAAADKVDVYPAIVIGAPKKRDMGNTAATFEAQLAITSVPAEDVAVAA